MDAFATVIMKPRRAIMRLILCIIPSRPSGHKQGLRLTMTFQINAGLSNLWFNQRQASGPVGTAAHNMRTEALEANNAAALYVPFSSPSPHPTLTGQKLKLTRVTPTPWICTRLRKPHEKMYRHPVRHTNFCFLDARMVCLRPLFTVDVDELQSKRLAVKPLTLCSLLRIYGECWW